MKQRSKQKGQQRYRNRKKNQAPAYYIRFGNQIYHGSSFTHALPHTRTLERTHARIFYSHRNAVHSCNKRDVRALRGDQCMRADAVRQCVVACVRAGVAVVRYEGGPCVWV